MEAKQTNLARQCVEGILGQYKNTQGDPEAWKEHDVCGITTSTQIVYATKYLMCLVARG